MAQEKYLVELVRSVDHKHVFFVIWAGITGIFSYLMYAYYKKTQVRNFREDSQQVPKSSAVTRKNSDLSKR